VTPSLLLSLVVSKWIEKSGCAKKGRLEGSPCIRSGYSRNPWSAQVQRLLFAQPSKHVAYSPSMPPVCILKLSIMLATISMPACNTATAEEPVAPAQEQLSPGADRPATDGFADLYAMTLPCPSAALNAAAREAAKVQAQAKGHYQFVYFKIIDDSDHYEVHFTSNDPEEPDLNYCVSVYCQQGWDPNTTTSVSLMKQGSHSAEASAMGSARHIADCGDQQMPVQP
jgi:hypothetical protein